MDNDFGDKLELKVCTCKKSQETQDIPKQKLLLAVRYLNRSIFGNGLFFLFLQFAKILSSKYLGTSYSVTFHFLTVKFVKELVI